MMTDFPRASEATAPCALSRKKSDSAKPPSASPTTRRKLRRERPSQKRSLLLLKKVNMQFQPAGTKQIPFPQRIKGNAGGSIETRGNSGVERGTSTSTSRSNI